VVVVVRLDDGVKLDGWSWTANHEVLEWIRIAGLQQHWLEGRELEDDSSNN